MTMDPNHMNFSVFLSVFKGICMYTYVYISIVFLTYGSVKWYGSGSVWYGSVKYN